MIVKLMLHTINIQTGRRFMVFAFALVMLNGCYIFEWDHCGPYRYLIQFGNDTNDTIDLLLFPHDHSEAISLLPDTFVQDAEFCLEEGEDPFLDGVFSEVHNMWWDEISIRWDDSMLHTWHGPYGTVPDTIRSFFNENSWDIVPYDSLPGHWYIRFIIQESDLVENHD